MGDEMETIGGTVKTRDNTWGFETKEESNAVYLMGNFGGVIGGGLFDGMEYSGNMGARYVQNSAEEYYQEIEERFLGYKLNDTMVNLSIQAVL
jgi:hypothetical protein